MDFASRARRQRRRDSIAPGAEATEASSRDTHGNCLSAGIAAGNDDRLFLTGIHGLSPAQVYGALITHASATVAVNTGSASEELADAA